MRASHRLRQHILGGRDRNQVHGVGHQAVPDDSQAIRFRTPLEHGEIDTTIVVREEHILTVVAPLGDMMRNSGHDRPRDTRHIPRLPRKRGNVNTNGGCPYYPLLSPIIRPYYPTDGRKKSK
ncbi:MAG: hypothetical protein ACE5F9_12460, partial [Phycisphaerae bacterium]